MKETWKGPALVCFSRGRRPNCLSICFEAPLFHGASVVTAFIVFVTTVPSPLAVFLTKNMSFERISESLRELQESNAQLRDLIDRLATIKFQPGSLPLDNDDDNVLTELRTEIFDEIKEQGEKLEILNMDVEDLGDLRGEEAAEKKRRLEGRVERAAMELKE